jgi:hypothetical protein
MSVSIILYDLPVSLLFHHPSDLLPNTERKGLFIVFWFYLFIYDAQRTPATASVRYTYHTVAKIA